MLRPRENWPTTYTDRWYSAYAPDWLKALALRRLWPEHHARTLLLVLNGAEPDEKAAPVPVQALETDDDDDDWVD